MAQGKKRTRPPGRRLSFALSAAILVAGAAALVLWRGVDAVPIRFEASRPPHVALALPPEKPAAPTAGSESSAYPQPHQARPVSVQQASRAVIPPPRAAGEPAWLRNAAPARETEGKPMIAVVIDDMGVDHRRSIQALALPGPMTMAFLSYARDLPRMTRAARAVGHELLLHMPMQPLSADENPGPDAIVTGLDPAELRRRADAMLDSFDGYVGVNNHMGSKFTQDAAGMRTVLEDIHARGLLFLDSRTIAGTAGPSIARALGMPYAERDVFLDNDASTGNVRAQLAEVEAVARRQGYAIAIGHPHDGTVEALAQWLPDIEARGFALVPVSAIVKARMAACSGQSGIIKVSHC